MYSPQHTSCLVDGCTTPTHGKSYCRPHMKNKANAVLITDEQRTFMRSDCCNAHCIEGTRHEYGRQYCALCKAACLWHPSALMRAV